MSNLVADFSAPAAASSEQLPAIRELVHSIFNVPLNSGLAQVYNYHWFNSNNLDNLRVINYKNKPISFLGICEREITAYDVSFKVGSIGSVCTHPEYRGRGLATLLLKDAIDKLSRDSCDVMLISGDRGLYRNLGCSPAVPVAKFEIRLQKAAPVSLIRIEELTVNDCADALLIYRREPVRFKRLVGDIEVAVKAKSAWFTDDKFFKILQSGELLGYCIVSQKRVAEYAGVRSALAGALPIIMEAVGVEQLEIFVPWYDTELLYILKDRGFQYHWGNLPGHTLFVINLQALWQKLKPYIDERLGYSVADNLQVYQVTRDRFILKLNGYEVEFKQPGLVKLLFGYINSNEREAIHSLSTIENPLHKLLSNIFPLPFPWPGLNKI